MNQKQKINKYILMKLMESIVITSRLLISVFVFVGLFSSACISLILLNCEVNTKIINTNMLIFSFFSSLFLLIKINWNNMIEEAYKVIYKNKKNKNEKN